MRKQSWNLRKTSVQKFYHAASEIFLASEDVEIHFVQEIIAKSLFREIDAAEM